jgi:hypothetical protein
MYFEECFYRNLRRTQSEAGALGTAHPTGKRTARAGRTFTDETHAVSAFLLSQNA